MKAEELSVLLLEDNSTWVGIGKRFLERVNIRGIDLAKNEQEAISYLTNRRYDLLLCDTMEMDNYPMGPNVAREAKKLGHTSVIVGLSASNLNKKLWEGLADYFFNKLNFYDNDQGLRKVLQEKFQIS